MPKVLGFARLGAACEGFDEVLVMEDVGPGVRAIDRIQELLIAGDESSLWRLEERIISDTAAIIEADLVDTDHSILNYHVTPEHGPVRIDFEQARRVWCRPLARRWYGQMLGRLTGSYLFAVQPDMERVRKFAARLADRIALERGVWEKASEWVEQKLEHQRRVMGIDMRVELPW